MDPCLTLTLTLTLSRGCDSDPGARVGGISKDPESGGNGVGRAWGSPHPGVSRDMQRAFRDAERGILQRRQDQPPPETEETDSETDGEGWETDSGGHQSEGGFSDFSDPDPEDPDE